MGLCASRRQRVLVMRMHKACSYSACSSTWRRRQCGTRSGTWWRSAARASCRGDCWRCATCAATFRGPQCCGTLRWYDSALTTVRVCLPSAITHQLSNSAACRRKKQASSWHASWTSRCTRRGGACRTSMAPSTSAPQTCLRLTTTSTTLRTATAHLKPLPSSQARPADVCGARLCAGTVYAL